MPYFCAPNLELDLSFLPPQAFTGQHILLSSLLQMLAFNRSNIWEAAAGFELWILEKKLLLLYLRILRTTFSVLREGRGPEGTETLEHKDCHRKGNKTLFGLCCKPDGWHPSSPYFCFLALT